jgi:hypothetical protein
MHLLVQLLVRLLVRLLASLANRVLSRHPSSCTGQLHRAAAPEQRQRPLVGCHVCFAGYRT